MAYPIQQIATVIQATGTLVNPTDNIEHLLTDSRKIVFPATSLFFALQSTRRNGHDFISEVYERGVRNFVVQTDFNSSPWPDANFCKVPDVLIALQALAAWHRSQFNIPVIGITGSNGKTIVKEWLYQLLRNDYNIVRSPRSYNSQIGVPLSVWQMNVQHTLAIFEAGISQQGEMKWLQFVIKPTIGVFTTLGNAHDNGFSNKTDKALNKFVLFKSAQQVIYPGDEADLKTPVELVTAPAYFSWGKRNQPTLHITHKVTQQHSTTLTATYKEENISITVPFTDDASVHNACTCWSVLLYMGYSNAVIAERMLLLQPVEMRLQLKKGINNCYILNDSYSNDALSLSIALDYLQQQAGSNKTTVILSDLAEASGRAEYHLYNAIAHELEQRGVQRLIGVGSQISQYKNVFSGLLANCSFYPSTEDFLQHATHQHFRDEYILLKGARSFAFERISKWLEQKVHQTVMEINLTAMVHNLKQYQQHLQPATKLMAMVKAFSYGSGTAEIARVLQFHKVDYLAVAYADEGVELRKAGISLPIMVMNADESAFDALVEYNLEPEMYSFDLLHHFDAYLQSQGLTQFPVHIKLNTGMNRLGFDPGEIDALCIALQQTNTLAIKSVFSHLAGSETADQDHFTQHQASLFNVGCSKLQQALGYTFTKHIANSAAIFRHPHLQYDMVRLGIGLYGVDSANGKEVHLETVATLKSTIAQIRTVKAGETIGYNRRGIVTEDSLIATIRIGYADGFSRRLGNGVGSVYINGSLAPVIGTVCMDMIMVNITHISGVHENDEVEIFGRHLPIQQVAQWNGTIAYEIMTKISQRVKRVYVEE